MLIILNKYFYFYVFLIIVCYFSSSYSLKKVLHFDHKIKWCMHVPDGPENVFKMFILKSITVKVHSLNFWWINDVFRHLWNSVNYKRHIISNCQTELFSVVHGEHLKCRLCWRLKVKLSPSAIHSSIKIFYMAAKRLFLCWHYFCKAKQIIKSLFAFVFCPIFNLRSTTFLKLSKSWRHGIYTFINAFWVCFSFI